MDGAQASTSSSDDLVDGAANDSDEEWQPQDRPRQTSSHPDGHEPSSSQASNSAAPVQKRRRVTRACDECRRKKIRCDGMQPCTHCTVYSYECTYDQPSNRRRNPTPQYVEALESRLQRAEALLRSVMPNIDLNDPQFDASMPQRMLPVIKQESPSQKSAPVAATEVPSTRPNKAGEQSMGSSDNLLESMVDHTGSLDLDDQGNWDYHGQSSGIVYLRCLRDQFGDLMGNAEGYGMPFLKTRNIASPINSTQPSMEPSMEHSLPDTEDLPPRECAVLLCENALDDACALMRVVHLPTFWDKFNRAYTLPPEQYRNAENKFLALLYVVLALGTVFAKAERSHLQRWGYENAIEQGFTWFSASRSMIDVTDCRDLTSLQTLLFMILFMQSSSRLCTCYSHIGIALRSSIRLGLHRSISRNFNPIEQEIRKRIFWVVRKMDIYVAALLGLPMFLHDEDSDQEMPLEVDDEFITSEQILPMPPGFTPIMSSFNAHTKLVFILAKTMRYIYPVKSSTHGDPQPYAVSHAKVREIERDLQAWMEQLPMALKPGGEAAPKIERVQQLLRMAYAYIQLFLYRPFLHYISRESQTKSIDKRSYACAAACVSVSRNIIHISDEMKKKGLLNGSYWFYMYTTFFAILALVFFVLENPDSPNTQEILHDALEGRDTLASLARTSMAADKSMETLKGLFEQLPRRLKAVKKSSSSQRKRQAPSSGRTEASKPIQSAKSAPPTAPQPTTKSRGLSKEQAQSSHNARYQSAKPLPSPQEVFIQQPHAFSDSRPNPNKPHGSDLMNPYSPESADASSFEGAGATPSTTTRSTFDFDGQYPNALSDMTNIMFPSPNPLAYPNQPMVTLEDQNEFSGHDTSISNPSDPSVMSSGSYGPADTQFFSPLPPYMMQFSQSGLGFQSMNMTTDMSSATAGSNSMALNHSSGAWAPEQMQQPPGTGEMPMNYDYPFGQGWMGLNYRQDQ